MNDPNIKQQPQADRQAPAQPKPWELPPNANEALPSWWTPETVKAAQAAKRAEAQVDDPPEVKLARLEVQRAEAWRGEAEYRAELERQKTKQAEVRFGGAQSQGLPKQAQPNDIQLSLNTGNETTVKIDYLSNPWLPRGQVIGFYGRGEGAKSTFVATLAAQLSDECCTLWVSTEEPPDWVKVRHSKSGGASATLSVYELIITKKDAFGRAAASSFNVYEHLDAAIQNAAATFNAVHFDKCPLRIVVLDTVVALTTWDKRVGSSNDDGAVKKLMAYLLMLAQKYDVCIVVIGHVNKGKHDHISDAVMGARAWVDSPRQSFLHLQDQRDEYSFVTYAIKASLTGAFAAPFKTVAIHELFKRPDGKSSVLCRAEVGELVWGKFKALDLVEAATSKDKDADEKPVNIRQQSIQSPAH
jgi:hypothetical protein